jgi:hypothetical protein
MGEVLNGEVRQFLPNVSRSQIEMIVLDHHQRRGVTLHRLLNNRLGEGLIDSNIAILPGIVDILSYIRGMGEIPHVMLQEPEERVAQDTVELMINVSRANHETKIKVLT